MIDDPRVREAVQRGVEAALAVLGPAPAAPAPGLPEWMSTAQYAAYIGKSEKTVRGWAQRAPHELAVKYGRDWRLAGPRFDAWVRAGGPFRQHEEDERQVH